MLKNIKIEAEHNELILKNSHGDHVIIPANKREWVKQKLSSNCNSCIDDFVDTLPVASNYAQDGSVYPPGKKVKVNEGGEIKEYKIDSSEYKKLYNSGSLASYDKENDMYIATSLPEIEITSPKEKTVSNFLNKWGENVAKGVTSSNPLVATGQALMGALQIPQAAATYLSTDGKHVVPSKALKGSKFNAAMDAVGNIPGAAGVVGKVMGSELGQDIVLDPLNIPIVSAASKLSKVDKALGTAKEANKVLKFDDLKNENEFFRVIVGDEAFDDIVQTQKIRTKKPSSASEQVSNSINLDRRGTTSFPSFSKGSPSLEYANNNPNHYIIRTADESIKPSTSGRHGKGTTMFPTDETGRHLTELDASKAQIYKHMGNGEYKLVTPTSDNKYFRINPAIEELAKEKVSEPSKARKLYTFLNERLNKERILAQDEGLEKAKEFSKLYWKDESGDLSQTATKKIQNISGEPYIKEGKVDSNIKKLSETEEVLVDPYSTEINKLSKKEGDYVKNNPLSIGGVNFAYVDDGGKSITLRNNLPFLYNSSKEVARVAIHEDGHTKQLLKLKPKDSMFYFEDNWGNELSKFDPYEAPYHTYADTELGQRYKKAMIEINPKAQEKYKKEFLDPERAEVSGSTKRRAYLHDATPIELHSDLMISRYEYYDKLIKGGTSKEEAIKLVREDSPEFLDHIVKTRNIKKFFKKETSVEEMKELIKILPAALPAMYLGSDNNKKEE